MNYLWLILMKNICVVCKKLAEVDCSCDNPARSFGNNEKLLEETNLQSFEFSKNLAEIQKQLQSNFNLFLEAHTSLVRAVAVTSDSKYIISGSSDNTIRI